MKRIIIILSLLILVSCEKVYDPERIILSSYIFHPYGHDQIFEAENYLNDSVGIRIINNIEDNLPEGWSIQFDVFSGGGSVEPYNVQINNGGYAFTKWKLGTESCEQVIQAHVINKSGRQINETYIRAFGLRTDEWNELPVLPHSAISDVVSDTVNGITFMISKGNLYKQEKNYYSWEKVEQFSNAPRTIEKSKNGILYIGNWYGELFKSVDYGNSWSLCSKPISNYSGYFQMVVSADNYIWVTTNGYDLRCSRDGGNTWTCDTIGLAPNELLGDIFRLSNGTILFHSLNCNLYKSVDDGKSWAKMNCPEYSIKLYVNEEDEIIIINQDDGLSIYKSNDLGANFYRVYNTRPQFGTLMDHIFQEYNNQYYILIPGKGVLKSKDLDSYEVHWDNAGLNNLFLDHNGVLIAKSWERGSVFYRMDNEN